MKRRERDTMSNTRNVLGKNIYIYISTYFFYKTTEVCNGNFQKELNDTVKQSICLRCNCKSGQYYIFL